MGDDFKILLERGEVIPRIQLHRRHYDLRKSCTEGYSHLHPFSKRIRGIDTFDEIHNVNSRQVINFGGQHNPCGSELRPMTEKGMI